MANKFYTIFTEIGKASVANAVATETKVSFDSIVLGDGNGSYYEPTESQTELKNEVWKGKVSSITIDSENPNWVVVESAIPGNIGGFTIREAGIVDDKGQLLVVAKYPETYKPKAEDGTIKDILIKLIVEVSNTECVSLKVDPTVILATKKDVDKAEKRLSDKKLDKDERLQKPGDIYSKIEVDQIIKNIKNELTIIINKKASSNHRHSVSDITGLEAYIKKIVGGTGGNTGGTGGNTGGTVGGDTLQGGSFITIYSSNFRGGWNYETSSSVHGGPYATDNFPTYGKSESELKTNLKIKATRDFKAWVSRRHYTDPSFWDNRKVTVDYYKNVSLNNSNQIKFATDELIGRDQITTYFGL